MSEEVKIWQAKYRGETFVLGAWNQGLRWGFNSKGDLRSFDFRTPFTDLVEMRLVQQSKPQAVGEDDGFHVSIEGKSGFHGVNCDKGLLGMDYACTCDSIPKGEGVWLDVHPDVLRKFFNYAELDSSEKSPIVSVNFEDLKADLLAQLTPSAEGGAETTTDGTSHFGEYVNIPMLKEDAELLHWMLLHRPALVLGDGTPSKETKLCINLASTISGIIFHDKSPDEEIAQPSPAKVGIELTEEEAKHPFTVLVGISPQGVLNFIQDAVVNEARACSVDFDDWHSTKKKLLHNLSLLTPAPVPEPEEPKGAEKIEICASTPFDSTRRIFKCVWDFQEERQYWRNSENDYVIFSDLINPTRVGGEE